MGRTLLILTFLLNALLLEATEQANDILLYKGDTIKIEEYPLASLMDRDSVLANKIYGFSDCIISSCWRQHIATWKIENDSLFLVGLKTCCNNKKIPLNRIFNIPQIKNNKVFAHWYSGAFYSGLGKYLGFSEKNWEEVYDKKIKMSIKEGKIVDLKISSSTDTAELYNNIHLIYKDSVITENRVGGINLGDDFNKLINKYDFTEDYNEYYLKIDNRLILSLWSQDQKTISGITVYSNDFKTQKKLQVGLEINKILKIYPDLKIKLSEETMEEYFSIGDYFDKNDNTFLIYLKSNTDNKLGRYNSDDFGPESDDFDKDGKIEKIEIFK